MISTKSGMIAPPKILPTSIGRQMLFRAKFNYIHPDEVTAAKRKAADALRHVAAEQADFSGIRESIMKLIAENDALRAEAVRLKIENGALLLRLDRLG